MKDYITSLIRHGLTAVGGSLVTKGVITSSMFDEVVGALVVIAGILWSIVSKMVLTQLHLEKLVEAINSPAPATPVTVNDIIDKK